MKVLLIGCSRIGRRRVLPALHALAGVKAVAVASRTAKRASVDADEFYNDYDTALARSGADLAYVSLANSDHAHWVRRSLEAGYHVVVDKPACLSVGEAQQLIDLAVAKRRCLAEATVFAHHPQLAALQQAFASAGASPSRAVAVFSFPPLDSRDFRYRREQGGGALYDLGPYVVATSRILFQRPPRTVCCKVLSQTADGLETAFGVLLTYEENGALAGHFGFDTEYQNRLLVLGSGVSVELNRAFTLPADVPGRLIIKRNNIESEINVSPADAFQNFLQAVVDAIERNAWETFLATMLADAQLLWRLRQAMGEG